MKKGMIPAPVGRGCGNFQSHRGSPSGPPASLITPAPPPELVAQNLQKRAEATCGYSGTDFYSCPLDSYCIYNTAYGRFDCCSVSSDSSIASTCDLGHTVCYGSSASLSAFGTNPCSDSTACCGSSAYSECVTAILSVDPSLSYSSFFCSETGTTITITPMEDYLAQTSLETVTETPSTVTEMPSTITESASTVTESASTVTMSASTIIITPSSRSLISVQPTNHATATKTGAAASSAIAGSTLADNSPQITESTFDQHKGAIIGGTVAAIVLILLIALAFLIRHRIKVKKREAGLYGGQEMSGRVVSDGTVYSRVSGG